MRIWPFIFSLLLLCTLAACRGTGSVASTNDAVQDVVTLPENSSKYDGLPADLTEALRALKFDVDPAELKIVGGIPEARIRLYAVAAYAEYADGWLVASGYGEWGGVIFWVDKIGGYEVILSDDYTFPIDMMADGNVILILLSPSTRFGEGQLLEVNRTRGGFETTLYPMKIFPRQFEEYEGEWIVPSRYVQRTIDDKKYHLVSELRAGKPVLYERE